MSLPNEDFLQQYLNERRVQGTYRQLSFAGGKVDFCSNDYLGLAHDNRIRERTLQWMRERHLSHGSTGSRLLAGQYPLLEEAELYIAQFHHAPSGLIFNSGYDANLGLFATVPQKGDTVVYDQLIHASIRDGIRLSRAQSFSFAHNDPTDLEKKLQHATGRVFVVVESVYSMDGDQAPLKEVVDLCEKYAAYLIVDEAHATGVIGEKGEGLVQALQLQAHCFARVHTFGKAVGVHGAIILGSDLLRDYLINFARSLIYTTALPPVTVAAILSSYGLFPSLSEERLHLHRLISRFQSATLPYAKLTSTTPIQILIVPGNENAKKLAIRCQEHRLDVRPILHPTVARGQERLRIVLHSFNTFEEMERLIGILSLPL